MKYIKKLKLQLIVIGIFLISLLVIIFDNYKYTNLADIRIYTYLLYLLVPLSFFTLIILTVKTVNINKVKEETRVDKIINYLFLVILFLGLLAISFGLMLSRAYVLPPVDETIEEVRRYLEESKIITLGKDIYVNSMIAIALATAFRLFYIGIRDIVLDK